MSQSFLLAAARRASDAPRPPVQMFAPRTPVPVPVCVSRPPALSLTTSCEANRTAASSCVRTVARFLQTPRRRSCAFVNPSEEAFAEISRAAKECALQLTQSSEINVGSVVRLSRLSLWSREASGLATVEGSPNLDAHPVQGQAVEELDLGAHPAPAPCATPDPGPCVTPTRAPALPVGIARTTSFATEVVVNQVRRVVSDSESRPALTEDGTGGVYVIRESSWRSDADEVGGVGGGDSQHSPLAVFKPSDEEAGSANNPRGLTDAAMREGFRPGGGAVRERIAYKLGGAFAGVPRTAVDKLLLRTSSGLHLREQSGSIQEYVASDGDASGFRFDGSEFSERGSHRLALLDVRLFNTDRHEGNILVRRPPPTAAPAAPDEPPPRCEVVPIDHAFCLPAFGHYREAEFAWRYWGSAAAPFGRDGIEHVRGIDVEADVQLARAAGLDEPACATLRVCALVLRRTLLAAGGAAVTPNALAELLMRAVLDEPSPLERWCGRALGVPEAALATDAGLLEWIAAEQQRRGGRPDAFVPPDGFYAKLEDLLEHEYGPLQPA